MAKKTKDSNLSIEERLEQALIPNWDEPYKLPQNWCWVRVDAIASIYTGNSINECVKEEKYTGRTDGLVYLATKDIDFDSTIDYDTNVCIPQSDGFKVAPKYSTLLCIEGGSAGRKIGFITQDVCFVNKLCAFVPHGKINPKYLYYAIQSDAFKKQFDAKKHGLIGGVSVKEVSSIFIPFAPIEIQNKIVELIESVFNKLDEAKEKAQEVVDGFETRKAAILHKAFSGELTAKWRTVHSDQIGEIDTNPLDKNYDNYDIPYALPKSWRWVRFNECCTFVGSGITPKGGKEVYQLHGVPFIRSQNVLKGALDLSDVAYVSPEIDNLMKRTRILGGETLFNITGASIGRSCFVPVSQTIGNVNQHVCIIRYKNYIKPELPQFWLNSPYVQAFVVENQVGQTRQALNFKQIRGMYYPLAPTSEQTEMVRILENLLAKEQQAKETAETVIDQIDTMKKAILARTFRGELGTNDPSEESALELLKSVLMGNTNQQEPQKSSKKSISIPNHIETALLTKLEKKIVSLFYTTERKVVSVDEIMSVSSKKIDIIDTLTKLEQRGILIRLNNSCYRIKE